MKLPRISLRELFLLVVIAAMGCGWWVQYSISANKLHWAILRADTNDQAISEVCKAFEREGYTCDLSFVTTDYGDFYTGMNVMRPTDSSFRVELPGERFRQYSVDLRRATP